MMVLDPTPLQLGIAAIKEENNELARKHLIRAISEDPDNPEPWLWLGVIAANNDERIQYLEQAVSLNPGNQRATRLLEKLQTQRTDEWENSGITEVQKGNLETGRELLAKVVDADETRIKAWWWLGQASHSTEDKTICYQNILKLDPTHIEAQLALESLKQIEIASAVETGQPSSSTTIQDDSFNHLPDRIQLEEQNTTSSFILSNDEVDSLGLALNCSFCAGPTGENDQKCPHCNRNLFIQQRLITQVKPAYKVLFILELAVALGSILILLLILGYLDMYISTPNKLDTLRIYFTPGLSLLNEQDVDVFTIISPIVVYATLAGLIITILTMICIVSRWRTLFYAAAGLGSLRILLIIFIMLSVISAINTSKSMKPMVLSGDLFIRAARISLLSAVLIAGLLSIIALIALINVYNHFEVKQKRRLLQLDVDVSGNSTAMRQRARLYAQSQTWAMAALHARSALMLENDAASYTLLATAYYHLGWHQKVSQILNDALRLYPNNSQIVELRDTLTYNVQSNNV